MNNSAPDERKSPPDIKWLRYPNISWIIPIVVFLLVGSIWWRLSVSYQNYLFDISRSRVQNKVDGIATSLTSAINHRLALLTGLESFIELYSDDVNFKDQFAVYSSGLYADDPIIRAIQFFPVDGYELIYPISKNETLIGRKLADLINDSRPEVRADVQRAIDSRKITLSEPYELLQGGKGVVARLAVYKGEKFLGLTVVVLNLDPLLAVSGLIPPQDDLLISLKDSKGIVFFGNDLVHEKDAPVVQIPLPEGYWTLTADPITGWQTQNQLQFNIFWLTGILLAMFLSGISFLIIKRQMSLTQRIEVQNVELGDSEERYRRLFDTSLDAILITAPSGEVFAANPSACRIFGRTEEELCQVGRNGIANLADPKLPMILEQRARNGYFFGEMTFLRRNGEIFTGEVSTAVYKDSQGRERTSMIIRDITDRKLAEEAQHRSEERFYRLAESSLDYIMLYDREFHHVYENPAGLKASGKTREEMIGKTHREAGFSEEMSAMWENDIQQVFSTAQSSQRIFEWDAATGKVILDWRLSPIFGEDGNVELVLGISRDVTSLKKAEERLNIQLNELQRWHEVTLGREMRIRELKDEVNQLLVRDGKEPRYPSLDIE